MNPTVTVINVGTTPVVVFSGTGKVSLRSVNGSVRFGDANLNPSDLKTRFMSGQAAPIEFRAPATIYAATASGTDDVTVEVWY